MKTLKKLIRDALNIAPEIDPLNMWRAVQAKGDWSKEEVNKAFSEVIQKMGMADPHIVVGPAQKTLEEVIENAERKKEEKERNESAEE